jgi:type IV pilus assembly protein PilB
MKLMSGMNIAERRIPQDGRIKMPVDGEQIDFRVSACPAYHGESVVLRILRPESVKIGLQNLGFEPDNLDIFNRIIRRPNGIFLVTGPTGSGKTTTLYSALDVLNRPDKKIITAEDPVEYNFTGINQCQVRESIGLTLPSDSPRDAASGAEHRARRRDPRPRGGGNRHPGRADRPPRVQHAAHQRRAVGDHAIDRHGRQAVPRGQSIQAIMAQRLIRVLCDKCKERDPDPDPRMLKLLGIEPGGAERQHLQARSAARTAAAPASAAGGDLRIMRMNSESANWPSKRAIGTMREAASRRHAPLVGDGKIKVLAA